MCSVTDRTVCCTKLGMRAVVAMVVAAMVAAMVVEEAGAETVAAG
jgi:hypothetical protein